MDSEHTANGDPDAPTNRLGETSRPGETNRLTEDSRDQPADHQLDETSRETRRPGQRYTVQEAAEALGTTVDAVRGRIRRGTLDSMKQDGVVYVLLDKVSRDRHADHTSATADEPRPSLDQSGLVGELRDQIEWLRREVERKDTIIMSLTQRIPELEPPASPGASHGHETAAEASGNGDDVPPEPQKPLQRRSWLHRFFFGPS